MAGCLGSSLLGVGSPISSYGHGPQSFNIIQTSSRWLPPALSGTDITDTPNSAGNNTNLNITVILNPCSGPCIDGMPEQVYLDEMPKLRNYPNIRSLGYVATNYTNRPIEDVMLEIRTYADWPRILNDERVGVDGIFFDETPGTYDWQWHDYLEILRDEVKGASGLGERVVGELSSVLLLGVLSLSTPIKEYMTLCNTADLCRVYSAAVLLLSYIIKEAFLFYFPFLTFLLFSSVYLCWLTYARLSTS
jgi:hypothetical protein